MPIGFTSASAPGTTARAIAPVAGVLLIAMAVILAAGVTTATLDAPDEPAPTALLSLSADGDRIAITHEAGDPVEVDELTVRVRVNDEPLARQPSIPFFSAAGFQPGPTGPFNAASNDDEWSVGEVASFRIAGTNDPTPAAGDRVEVRLVVRGRLLVSLDARA